MSGDLNWSAVLPFLVTGLGALTVLGVDGLLTQRATADGPAAPESRGGTVVGLLYLGILVGTFALVIQQFASAGYASFQGSEPLLRIDRLSCFGMAVVLLGAIIGGVLSLGDLPARGIPKGEYYGLTLLAVTGMTLLVSATNLLLVLVALELVALPVTALVAIDERREASTEAALKLFLSGATATALLALGMALLWGTTGHADYYGLHDALLADPAPLTWAGVGLLVTGFGWKISAAPFHFWKAEVLDTAPSSVGVLLTTSLTSAAFVALLRLFSDGLAASVPGSPLPQLFSVMAVLSLCVGASMALLQERMLRLLAYASLSQAGVLLIGLVAATRQSYGAILFLLLVWTFLSAGFFVLVMALGLRDEEGDRLSRLAGLFESRPALAALLILFSAALAGVPGTAGFVAKWNLFYAAVAADHPVLAAVGLAAWAVTGFAFLRIPVLIIAGSPVGKLTRRILTSGEVVVLLTCAFFVLALGLFPNASPGGIFAWLRALDWSRSSVAFLF